MADGVFCHKNATERVVKSFERTRGNRTTFKLRLHDFHPAKRVIGVPPHPESIQFANTPRQHSLFWDYLH